MSTKKKSTPAKKTTHKNKIVGPKPSTEWVKDLKFLSGEQPPYMEAFIKKCGGEIPQGVLPVDAIKPPPQPMFEMLLADIDAQLSRYYNSLNALFAMADSLGAYIPTLENVATTNLIPPKDYIGRLNYHVGTFMRENNRIEELVDKLQKVI